MKHYYIFLIFSDHLALLVNMEGLQTSPASVASLIAVGTLRQ